LFRAKKSADVVITQDSDFVEWLERHGRRKSSGSPAAVRIWTPLPKSDAGRSAGL
jgi:hypothetical protein